MIIAREYNGWPKWPLWGESEFAALRKVLINDHWSCGKAIEVFEETFADFCGCKHALLVTSATAGLVLALRAAGIGPGDEVIVPGLTWPATALAVLECGAVAVIVDVDPATYAVSTCAVEREISQRTKAIVPVHLFNSTADIETLSLIAKESGLLLIEDAAQVVGCRWKGCQLGTWGAAGVISFQEKKLMTCGEGGCLITNDDSIYAQAYALRHFGMRWGQGSIERCGTNSSMSTILAAILSAQLQRLPMLLAAEESAGMHLSSIINKIPGAECLRRRDEISRQTFYNFCFRLVEEELVANANMIRKELASVLNIPFTSSYPSLIDKSYFDPAKEIRYRGLVRFSDLTYARRAKAESIRFPHQYLLSSRADIEFIGQTINDIIERQWGTI